jgi:hypothetical protein
MRTEQSFMLGLLAQQLGNSGYLKRKALHKSVAAQRIAPQRFSLKR